jgi:hypothetical protein
MKEILPISIWHNGKQTTANYLQLYCNNDNLTTVAQFFYALYSLDQNVNTLPPYTSTVQLASGNLTMTGDAYDVWEQNQYAWDWAAEQLSLTFAPTTTTTSTTEAPTTTSTTTKIPGVF